MSWQRETFIKLNTDYQKIIHLLRDHPDISYVIASNIRPSEAVGLPRLLLKSCSDLGTQMMMMKPLVKAEFEFAKKDVTTFMRERSRLPNRYTGSFLLQEGQDYLKKLLEKPVMDILDKRMLNMEIDPDKTAQNIQENQIKLGEVSMGFLERIVGDESLAMMPRSIRALCRIIYDMGIEFGCDEDTLTALLGNLIILRFINPAICIPDFYNVVPASKSPNFRARRNLILTTKILQALANGVPFGDKEEYMIPLQEFVVNNLSRVREFLLKVKEDPSPPEEGEPFSDLYQKNPLSNIDMKTFKLRELAITHRCLAKYKDKLVERLGGSDTPAAKAMFDCLEVLGVPPPIAPEPWYDPENPRVKEYHVVKTNKRGKKQARLIKFTVNSLLNVEKGGSGDSGKIKNELLVAEIQDIQAPARENLLTLTFSDVKIRSSQPGYFPSTERSSKKKPRIYECTNSRMRDEILGEIFEMCFNHYDNLEPIAFSLIKVNNKGKKQGRVFKLSKDSLLNLNGCRIKTEKHFGQIEYAKIDATDPKLVWLKFKDEEVARQNICKDNSVADALVQHLTDGIHKFET